MQLSSILEKHCSIFLRSGYFYVTVEIAYRLFLREFKSAVEWAYIAIKTVNTNIVGRLEVTLGSLLNIYSIYSLKK